MIDPFWLGVFIVLILLTAFVVPKAMKVETGRSDELLSNGLIKKQTGNITEAEYLLKRALEAFDTDRKPEFSKKCSCLLHLADCYAKSGNHAEARHHYQKLIDLWKSAIRKDDPDVFLDIDYQASTADFGSATNDIADCYLTIVEAKKQAFGVRHPDVANSLLIYSRLLTRLGRKEEAEKIEAEAKSIPR